MMKRERPWSVLTLVLAAVLLTGEGLVAARLRSEAIDGWNRYVAAVEARRHRDRAGTGPFLVLDTLPGAAAARGALFGRQLVIRVMDAAGAAGQPIDVSGALVHHWLGAVFLPGANLDRLIGRLEREAPPPGRDILQSAVLIRGPSFLKVWLRVERTRFVTVVLDTEHDVRFTRETTTRASSTSTATRIVELENVGTPAERARPAGDDRGFLWRLNAYWRYEVVPGGLIAECESVSLSRSVPFGLQTVVAPFIGSAARESMERALEEVMGRAR